MYILANMWFTKLIKQFFFWIDKIVYNFISSIYDLMITIARTSVLTQADIADMADRIYKLLAIFMIFKVTLSLITYVVNPDDFSDKSKGVSKLGTNIIISLAMLILTPYIFNYAYQFQTIILEDNSLATLIFGESTEEKNSFFNSAGDDMAFITMSAFISPNLSLGNLHECSILIDSGTKKFNQVCSGVNDDFSDANVEGSLMSFTKDNPNFSEQTLKNYIGGVENNSLGLLFRQDLVLATDADNEEFIMDYKFIFSTVVGVVIILLLISFCMDVAVRSIKLAFLQLVAPIPILSFVDPKSGKDGLFKKWYEMCFKTYLSLFIRLIALYFAVYIVSKVAEMKMVDIVDGSYQTNALVAIFIIIGALMFAKQLPKILEGLGIKLDSGSFTLNPLRKMEKEALGGKILKKPNDMLAKGAKAAALSPFTGASLGARKLMAGVDSAAHGKGFWNGTKNVKGKIAQAKDKFMEKNLPHTTKSLKDKKEGRDEIALMRSNWKAGSKAVDKLQKSGYTLDHLDGDNNNSDAYTKAGFSGRFKDSKMKLDYATERKKLLQRAYNARQMGKTADSIIAEEAESMKKYGVSAATIKSETQLSQALENQNKQVSGLEKVHESYRKQNSEQARLEDQIKFVKYNNPDPTSGESIKIEKRTTDSSNNGGGSNSSNDGGGSSSPNNGGGSNSSNDGGGSSPSNNGGGSNSSSDVGSSSSSNDGGGSNSSQQNPNDAAAQERERMKREIDAQVEELEKRIKNINETFEARKKVYEPRIKSLEELLERYKDQRKNAPDTASRDAIDKDIDQAIANLDREKANLKRIEEEKEKQIEILKKQIETLKSGV